MPSASPTVVKYSFKLGIIFEALIWVFADAKTHEDYIHDISGEGALNNVGTVEAVHTVLTVVGSTSMFVDINSRL
jgi:hypothetical protein